MITIDGNQWPVPCDIEREAEVKPSEISGMMLDKTYFNDVLGTYMRYDVSIAVPPKMARQYDELYETLTDPVDGHAFVMPHGQGTLEITGRVESVRDTLVYTASHRQYWKGITFTVIANHPSKVDTLEGVLVRGRSPLPEEVAYPVGTVMELTSTGWEKYVPSTYPSADEVYY
jgi:hypothetical protein